MSAVLAPGTRLLDRLHYRATLVVAGSLVGVCIAGIAALLVLEIGLTIDSARSEASGAAFLRPVQAVMVQAQKHRGLTNALLNGDAGAEQPLRAARSASQAAIAEMVPPFIPMPR